MSSPTQRSARQSEGDAALGSVRAAPFVCVSDMVDAMSAMYALEARMHLERLLVKVGILRVWGGVSSAARRTSFSLQIASLDLDGRPASPR